MKRHSIWRRFGAAILIFSSLSLTSCTSRSLVTLAKEDEDNADTNTTLSQTSDNKIYIDYLTGEETSLYDDELRPISFCVENNGNLSYGVSSAQILIEEPESNEKTKMCVITNKSIARIGVICDISDSINVISKGFDAINVNENIKKEGVIDSSFDTELFFRYEDKLMGCSNNYKEEFEKIGVSSKRTKLFPLDFGENTNETSGAAKYIILPFFETLTVSFSYSKENDKYIRMQNQKVYKDADGESLKYTNLIILKCNASTYTTKNSSYTTLDTNGVNEGYYCSKGKYEKLIWYFEDDNIIFLNSNGEKLSINKGNTYIAMIQVDRDIKIGN